MFLLRLCAADHTLLMPYSLIYDVPAPIEAYDAVHATIMAAVGDIETGMLLHIGRPTETGFQIIEVWESKEHSDRFGREIAAPAIAKAFGPDAQIGPPPVEFELRGLVVPSAGLAI